MKYIAMITFGHSGVTIPGGSVFNSEDVGFSYQDIDFLKSTGKIMPVQSKEEVLKSKKLTEEKIEIQVVEVSEDVDIALEEAEIPEPHSGVDVGEPLNEEVGEEGEPGLDYHEEDLKETEEFEKYDVSQKEEEEVVVNVKEEDLPKQVEESSDNIAYKLQLEKDDDIAVVMKESDLLKLRKDELVDLAVKLGIDITKKTRPMLAHEIAEVNE